MADTSLSGKKIGLLVWQVSNHWQNKLRFILKNHKMTLNEFLLLESIYELQSKQKTISQNELSIYSGIDTAVVSVVIKNLERKKFIKRITDIDNRKKSIEMLSMGSEQFNIIYPKVITEEQNIFSKLQNEKNNFTNSLRLILGKKLRIKVDNSI
tara:strand:- start:2184 stop:2645 length:462 start_codon:yes stop_codon:yes gene_type:complete